LEFKTFEDLENFVNGDLKLKFEGKKWLRIFHKDI
jgi:hypothetical protein